MKWRALAVVVAVAALAWLFWQNDGDQHAPAPSAEVADAPKKSAPTSATRSNPTAQDSEADEALKVDLPPPLIDRPMTEADGILDVLVLAGEAPVGGASVTSYWRGERDPNTNTYPFANAGAAQTGKDGRARLYARRGSYTVAVKHADYAWAYAEVYRPSDEPITKTTIVLQRGVEVRGETVREDDGSRVALVELTLSPDLNVPGSEKLRARSDQTGAFVIKGIAPGNYNLEARKEGEGSGHVSQLALPTPERLLVKLAASAFLNGYVRTSKGEPAAGALVTAIGQRQPVQAKSGRSGAFAIEVPPGAYTLQALLGDETGAANDSIRVSSGKTINGIEIKLGAPASISGRVTDASTNEPVRDARIDVSPYRENGDSGRARSDADGRFTVRPLAPGSYDVVVSSDAFSSQQRRGITLANGEQFEMTFLVSRPGRISGRVVDEQDAPVSGALVAIGDAEQKTTENGMFSFDNVTPGTMSLQAWREHADSSQWTRVKVTAGQTADTKIVLPQLAQLEVRVVDEANNLITAGELHIEPTRGSTRVIKQLDGSNSYTFSLSTGTYRALFGPVRSIDLAGRSEPIALEPQRVRSLTLVVKPTGAEMIRGVIIGVDGLPPERGSVRIEPSDPSVASAQTHWRVTDQQGRFTVRKPAASKPVQYTVRGFDNRWRNSERVPVDGEVVLRLRPNGALSGTVQGRREGETLRVEYDSDTDDQTLEFAGPSFSFRDVPVAEDASVRVVSSAGRKAEAKHIVIKPGETTQLTLTLD